MRNETRAVERQVEFAPFLSRIKKLQSDRGYRDGQHLFFAEGIRNFVQAIDHQYPIETIIYSEKLLISPVARKIVRRLKREGVPYARVTPEEYRQISVTERAAGIAAVYRQRILNISQINFDHSICWTALSDLRSSGNLGTLLRTSAAVGAGGLIVIGNQIDPFDPQVVRASMGALFKQGVARVTAQEFNRLCKTHKLQVVGSSPAGQIDYDKISYRPRTVLMLGNERKGLSHDEQALCRELVRIPMAEGTDSLNVAVAGSLLLYEVYRSKRGKI